MPKRHVRAPTDATMRNVRATAKAIVKLTARVVRLEKRVATLIHAMTGMSAP